MSPVAIRFVCRLLAAAQPDGLALVHGKLLRHERATLVRAVAKRLFLRFATGTPPIRTGGKFAGIGCFLGNDWLLAHVHSLSWWYGKITEISIASIISRVPHPTLLMLPGGTDSGATRVS